MHLELLLEIVKSSYNCKVHSLKDGEYFAIIPAGPLMMPIVVSKKENEIIVMLNNQHLECNYYDALNIVQTEIDRRYTETMLINW